MSSYGFDITLAGLSEKNIVDSYCFCKLNSPSKFVFTFNAFRKKKQEPVGNIQIDILFLLGLSIFDVFCKC